MGDETVGEVVEKVEALGTYAHVDGNGQVWHLKYLGSARMLPDGTWTEWVTP